MTARLLFALRPGRERRHDDIANVSTPSWRTAADHNFTDAALVGTALLNDPVHSKDTAFSAAERKAAEATGGLLTPQCFRMLERRTPI